MKILFIIAFLLIVSGCNNSTPKDIVTETRTVGGVWHCQYSKKNTAYVNELDQTNKVPTGWM